MHVVPVLDVLDGRIVHAVRGARDRYRPLESPLARGSSPGEILAALLSVYPFAHCYCADLNAILGRGASDHEIATLVAQHREIEFWVDAGFGARSALPDYLSAPNVSPVLGSESLASFEQYRELHERMGARMLLSLDHRGTEFLGPPQLATEPVWWPPRVVAMNLARVGSGDGPDFDLLARLRTRASQCRMIAAGGVRDEADLAALRAHGIDAVLIATALHRGSITRREIERVTR